MKPRLSIHLVMEEMAGVDQAAEYTAPWVEAFDAAAVT